MEHVLTAIKKSWKKKKKRIGNRKNNSDEKHDTSDIKFIRYKLLNDNMCIMESYNIKTLNRRPHINYEIGE